jgi:DYW family of nucleic acid deaminases
MHKREIVEFLARTRQELISQHDYHPDTTCVLQPNLSGKDKLERLWLHSEKMALAWAMINSSSPHPSPSHHSHSHGISQGDTIIMHKNLRVCHDCHTAIKLISRIYSTKNYY